MVARQLARAQCAIAFLLLAQSDANKEHVTVDPELATASFNQSAEMKFKDELVPHFPKALDPKVLDPTLKKDALGYTRLVVAKSVDGTLDRKFRNCHDTYMNEKYWLQRLASTGAALARPVAFEDANRTIFLEYAGAPLSKSNLPHDWSKQLSSIINALARANCSHNDIKTGELLVDRMGRITLVDFGWASEGESNPSRGCDAAIGLGGVFKCPTGFNDTCSISRVLGHVLLGVKTSHKVKGKLLRTLYPCAALAGSSASIDVSAPTQSSKLPVSWRGLDSDLALRLKLAPLLKHACRFNASIDGKQDDRRSDNCVAKLEKQVNDWTTAACELTSQPW